MANQIHSCNLNGLVSLVNAYCHTNSDTEQEPYAQVPCPNARKHDINAIARWKPSAERRQSKWAILLQRQTTRLLSTYLPTYLSYLPPLSYIRKGLCTDKGLSVPYFCKARAEYPDAVLTRFTVSVVLDLRPSYMHLLPPFLSSDFASLPHVLASKPKVRMCMRVYVEVTSLLVI